jgi:hypothetical protein
MYWGPTNRNQNCERPADGLKNVAINDAHEAETQEKRAKDYQEDPKLLATR